VAREYWQALAAGGVLEQREIQDHGAGKVTSVIVLGGTGMLGSMITDVMARDGRVRLSATARSYRLATHGRARLPNVTWKVFDVDRIKATPLAAVIDRNDWVINAIGITKPLIRDDDSGDVERAIRVNALFPHDLTRHAAAHGARIIQIATDCVFSGRRGDYVEDDEHDPLDVYGKSKSLGEVNSPYIYHLRCSIVGPELTGFRFLLEWLRGQPRGARVNGYANHQWNGITTVHFARICLGVIAQNIALPSVHHIVPRDQITKADLLRLLASSYERDDIGVDNVTTSQDINRVLQTRDVALNARIWQAAGYMEPPEVTTLMRELAQYPFALGHRASEVGA
jgi:dTDP-4-dehydrorhamnose reductase